MPYQELVDWGSFAVVMSGEELFGGGLKKQIDSLQSQVPRMKREVARVRHMFTYNFTVHYIANTVLGSYNY